MSRGQYDAVRLDLPLEELRAIARAHRVEGEVCGDRFEIGAEQRETVGRFVPGQDEALVRRDIGVEPPSLEAVLEGGGLVDLGCHPDKRIGSSTYRGEVPTHLVSYCPEAGTDAAKAADRARAARRLFGEGRQAQSRRSGAMGPNQGQKPF